jgi:hypothetical protein
MRLLKAGKKRDPNDACWSLVDAILQERSLAGLVGTDQVTPSTILGGSAPDAVAAPLRVLHMTGMLLVNSRHAAGGL